MYMPAVFQGAREDVTRALVRSHPFAMIVAAREDDVEIAHVPLLLDERSEGVRLTGHVARGNGLARLIAEGAPVTAVFRGPDAYVSASWYAKPSVEVPTWNYAVVHVVGHLRPMVDAALARALEDMARRFEASEKQPWTPDVLDPAFFADLRGGIVGFELHGETVRTKLKLSQNRSPEDRARVETNLASSVAPADRAVAALMKTLAT